MGEWKIEAQSVPIELKKIKWNKMDKGYPYGKMIMASKCIYMVTHFVIGKTTNKKALSCAHSQRVQISSFDGTP